MGRKKGSTNMIMLKSGAILIGGVEYESEIVSRGADGKFPKSSAPIQEDDSLIGESHPTSWG